mmetsp:Transcript_25239/g.99626  ORF Transcript_25239/g.99626 Transcript_25239/m.99626 type:complete len:210 (+) Transcript_25239:1015-1644(+)
MPAKGDVPSSRFSLSSRSSPKTVLMRARRFFSASSTLEGVFDGEGGITREGNISWSETRCSQKMFTSQLTTLQCTASTYSMYGTRAFVLSTTHSSGSVLRILTAGFPDRIRGMWGARRYALGPASTTPSGALWSSSFTIWSKIKLSTDSSSSRNLFFSLCIRIIHHRQRYLHEGTHQSYTHIKIITPLLFYGEKIQALELKVPLPCRIT